MTEIKLNLIKDNKGARHRKRIVGRGIASGLGKTCGRGGKGQTARSGVSINGFEGGQTPIYRRLPKRGFVNIHAMKMYEIDFNKIETLLKSGVLPAGQVIDLDFLKSIDYVGHAVEGLSLLGNGTPSKGLSLAVTRATKSAKDLLEKAGGSLTVE
jgi:large subunit ribosomal protein L15